MRVQESFGGWHSSQDDMVRAKPSSAGSATTGQPVHLAITTATSPTTLTLQCNFAHPLGPQAPLTALGASHSLGFYFYRAVGIMHYRYAKALPLSK